MSAHPFNKMVSIVEDVALDWLKELGNEVLSRLVIAPGGTAPGRSDYKRVFLFNRLQDKLEDLNPKIPLESLREALRKVRLISHAMLIENNRAFHRLQAALRSGELRVPVSCNSKEGVQHG